MQLGYGSYLFPRNSAEVTRSLSVELDQSGRPLKETWRYDVIVTLVCDFTDKLDRQRFFATMVNRIYTATSAVGGDLILYDNGGLPSDLALLRAGSIIAPRRVSFGNPVGGKSQHAGNRVVTFSFEAVYPAPGIGGLVSFTETLTLTGDGGPTKVMIVCQDVVVEQVTRGVSLCTANQTGTAVGYLAYPKLGPSNLFGAPPPRFKDGFRGNKSQISRITPQELGIQPTHFTVTWSYYSESPFSYKLT